MVVCMFGHEICGTTRINLLWLLCSLHLYNNLVCSSIMSCLRPKPLCLDFNLYYPGHLQHAHSRHWGLKKVLLNSSHLCEICQPLMIKIRNLPKFHFFRRRIISLGYMSGFVFPFLWEDNLLICNSCPILVLRLVNIASCDQNVWQMQKTSLQSLFNLDIKYIFTHNKTRLLQLYS